MQKTLEASRPAIKIYVSEKFMNRDILLEIMSGIEEESIPYEALIIEDDDAVNISYKAAMESVLSVGIGVDGKGILVVHYKNLPKDKPLFKVNYNVQSEYVRSTCSNAARLVKGTPFI